MVKWTADKDSFVLNYLLTTDKIKVGNDVLDGMIGSWPDAFGDKPTRKALTEHFGKLKRDNKQFSTGIPSTPISTTATPRKAKSTVKKTPASKKATTKRKRANSASDAEMDDDEPIGATEMSELGIKMEDAETPSKKPRRSTPKIKYEESDVEDHPSDLDDADYKVAGTESANAGINMGSEIQVETEAEA